MFLKKSKRKKYKLIKSFKRKEKVNKSQVKIRKTMLPLPKKVPKGEATVRKIYEENKQTLPHLPLKDDFLRTMNCLFDTIKYMAIPVKGGHFVIACFAIHVAMLISLLLAAIWKVFKVLAGKTLYSTGNRSVVARISGTIFYCNAVCSLILLWRLRKSWQNLSAEWAKAERSTGLYLPPELRLRKKMLFIIFFIVGGTIFEHAMSMLSTTGIDCPPDQFFKQYIIASHAFIMIESDYDVRLGVVIFVVNKTATFLWNFQDMLIILFSVGLTSRYRRLNLYMNGIKSDIGTKKDKSEYDLYVETQVWRKLREAYVRQAALVRRVDNDLGALILLSNSNNFYFICLQLFNGISQDKLNLIDRIYFGVSIGWLCLRACSVVLAAADINIHSKRALKSIRAYPQESYNIEVRRLEHQLSQDFVTLTGMGFFNMNRNMLLEMAAAIFRYELILLEFDR